MSNKPATNNKTTPRKTRSRTRLSSVVTKSEFIGGRLNVPTDPPSLNPNPWTSLTIVKASDPLTAAWEIKASELGSFLVSQIDSPDASKLSLFKALSVPMDFRVKSIMAWNLTNNSIALGAYNLVFSGSQDIIADVIDTRSNDAYPRAGYRWPLQMQNAVLSNNVSNPPKIATIFAPADSRILVYIHVQWKPSIVPTTPYNVLTTLGKIQHGVQSIQRATVEIAGTSKKIYKYMPATHLGVVPVSVVVPAEDAASVEEQLHAVSPPGEDTAQLLGSLEVISELERLRLRVEELENASPSATSSVVMIDNTTS